MRSLIALLLLVSPQLALADCICLNRGVEVPEGKTACIRTSNGPQLALCEKNLNVTSWKFLGQGCPVAKNDSKPAFDHAVATANHLTFTPASFPPSDQTTPQR